ncbi:MAG: cyclase family protein [Spirochaetia bacterium]
MKIIDLTRTIETDMQVFPGTEPPKLEVTNTLEHDGFREMRLTLYSHTGTHIDAPSHLLTDGATLSDLAPGSFFGRAALIVSPGPAGRKITRDELEPHEERIHRADFLLLHTGWGRYWGSPDYFGDFPVLDGDAAEWLTHFSLKGIGIDTISFDSMDSTDFPIHKNFLPKRILLIENLANLEELEESVPEGPEEENMYLSVFPLKVKGCDGSPVRAAVIIRP